KPPCPGVLSTLRAPKYFPAGADCCRLKRQNTTHKKRKNQVRTWVMSRKRLALGVCLSACCLITGASHGDNIASPPVMPSPPLCLGRRGGAPLPVTLAQWAEGAQLFEGLGDFHRAVTTSSTPAQAYFDQGMRLLWAFNHDEAARSFAKAASLDPSCALCFW